MTYPTLPDPGIGRNPPRYQPMASHWKMARLVGAVVVAFLFAGGIYYIFNVNQTTTADISPPATTGQSNTPSR